MAGSRCVPPDLPPPPPRPNPTTRGLDAARRWRGCHVCRLQPAGPGRQPAPASSEPRAASCCPRPTPGERRRRRRRGGNAAPTQHSAGMVPEPGQMAGDKGMGGGGCGEIRAVGLCLVGWDGVTPPAPPRAPPLRQQRGPGGVYRGWKGWGTSVRAEMLAGGPGMWGGRGVGGGEAEGKWGKDKRERGAERRKEEKETEGEDEERERKV